MNTTKIVEEVDKARFKDIVVLYKDKIYVNPHALDHLSEAQRKVFKPEELKNIINNENPRGVGIQKNGRYAAFYRRKEGFIRIILEKKHPRLEIITFTNQDYMPNLKRLEKIK